MKKGDCMLLDITLNFIDIKVSLNDHLVTVQFELPSGFFHLILNYHCNLHQQVTNCSPQQANTNKTNQMLQPNCTMFYHGKNLKFDSR